MSRRAVLALFLAIASGCSRSADSPTGLPVSRSKGRTPGLHALFIGSSLTTDIPELAQAMAAAGGVTLHVHGEVGGGMSLSDHWNGGQARRVLAGDGWDYLVLQQGPSTLPESQLDLRTWASRWADEARRHHAKTALYMVWALRGQPQRFPLVSKSYRAAAAAAQAKVLPAGEAWEDALRQHPEIELYQDETHATPAGAYLAALVITHGLTGVAPRSVPARLKLSSGREFAIPDDAARKLQRSAEKACGCGAI